MNPLQLPKSEELHSDAFNRYWNDAEFHARCEVVFQVLRLRGVDAREQLICALHLDDCVRWDFHSPESRCQHRDPERGQCWWYENAPHTEHIYTGDEFG